MGRAEAFSELNLVVQGTVRFGNGSLALIHGCGIMTLIKLVDVLCVWDRRRCLLARINRDKNWLYVLQTDVACGVYLGVRQKKQSGSTRAIATSTTMRCDSLVVVK
jgi:hypothetical protein